MQDYELTAYLGDAEVTDEQRRALLTVSDAIDARWPDPDDADERQAAFSAAVMLTLGDTTVEQVAHQAAAAQTALIEARAAQVGAALLLTDTYPSEQALADALGVTRVTVRAWLGK